MIIFTYPIDSLSVTDRQHTCNKFSSWDHTQWLYLHTLLTVCPWTTDSIHVIYWHHETIHNDYIYIPYWRVCPWSTDSIHVIYSHQKSDCTDLTVFNKFPSEVHTQWLYLHTLLTVCPWPTDSIHVINSQHKSIHNDYIYIPYWQSVRDRQTAYM